MNKNVLRLDTILSNYVTEDFSTALASKMIFLKTAPERFVTSKALFSQNNLEAELIDLTRNLFFRFSEQWATSRNLKFAIQLV